MSVPATAEQQPSHQAVTARDRSARGKVTGRLRNALTFMVWDGLKRDEAATKAGLKPHALYVALRKPHVKAFYLAELDVLRTSERARNILALTEVRDQTDNKMARVAAVKALEQLSDDDSASGSTASHSPGVVIQIVTQAEPKIVSHAVLTDD